MKKNEMRETLETVREREREREIISIEVLQNLEEGWSVQEDEN